MDIFRVAILFFLLPLGGSAPKVSFDLSAEAVAGREPHRRYAMLDSIDLLFTNNQGVGPEMQLRRKNCAEIMRWMIISLRLNKNILSVISETLVLSSK